MRSVLVCVFVATSTVPAALLAGCQNCNGSSESTAAPVASTGGPLRPQFRPQHLRLDGGVGANDKADGTP